MLKQNGIAAALQNGQAKKKDPLQLSSWLFVQLEEHYKDVQ